MKHIVAALVSVLLLAACVSGSSSPWNQTAARPAEQAPSALTHPGAQDPRLAYYRGLAHTVPHGAAQTGAPAAAATADTAYAPVPAPALPSVKVALLVPLSGPHAELGQGMLNAAQLALFDMGYDTFELMPRDTGNTPEAARQAAISAMQDGAQLILGPVFADAVRAVKPIAAQRGVNVVAFSTDWTLAGGNTYIMGFLPFGQVRRVTEYAAMNGIRRVGILAPDNEYGSAVINAYMAAAQETGMPAPAITRFPANQRDISDIVSRFADYDARMAQFAPRLAPLQERLKANPNDKDARAQIEQINQETTAALPYDAVLLPVGGERAGAIAGLLRFYGLEDVRMLGTGLWDDTALARQPALAGAWFAAPQPDLRAAFERKYRDTYGSMAPPRLATLAYDATALAAVLARNGVQTGGHPQFDHNSIANPNGFAGIDGIFRFRPDGLVERGQAVLTFRDMGIQMVDRAPHTFQSAAGYSRAVSDGGM